MPFYRHLRFIFVKFLFDEQVIKTHVIANQCAHWCGNLLYVKEYHTFSPARKYAKSRREPPVWFSDSPDGLRGKRIGFHIVPIVFRFPLRNPLARSTEIILILSALRTHSFCIMHFALCITKGVFCRTRPLIIYLPQKSFATSTIWSLVRPNCLRSSAAGPE